jgi:hypothetical protein
MIPGKIDLKITVDSLAREVVPSLKEVFTDALLDTADQLQQESYRGATLDLAGSWDINVKQKNNFQIEGEITNNSDRAINRVAGRGAGKAPPIEPLTDWIIAKGIATDRKRARGISFAIARKIAREGTDRYQANENFLGLNRDGSFKPNDRLEQIAREISEKIQEKYE